MLFGMVNQMGIGVRLLLWFKLECTHVTGGIPSHPTLVGWGANRRIGGINGWASWLQRVGLRWTAIVGQRFNQGIRNNLVTGNRIATVVLNEVVTPGDNVAHRARGKFLAGVPLISCDDRVGQRECRYKAATELANEER